MLLARYLELEMIHRGRRHACSIEHTAFGISVSASILESALGADHGLLEQSGRGTKGRNHKPGF